MSKDREFREELINETVVKAFQKPLYNGLYKGIDLSKISKVTDLSLLPYVTKDQMRESESSWAEGESLITNIQNTSGSTGRPFFIYRSQEEVSFVWDFFKRLLEPEKFNGQLPLQLNISIPQHGSPTPIPGLTHVLSASTTEDALVEHAFQLLQKEFMIPGHDSRVSILSGAHLPILLLTHLILERSLDVSNFSVKMICMTGRYLTKRWRDVIKSTWSASLVDRYSLSEVFGGATNCEKCGGYHFDTHVVPEIVDVNSGELVESGRVGALLLTTLYPFVQAQPFVRYWTGDLFSSQDSGCPSESYYFFGRVTHGLFSGEAEKSLILPGVAVLEALDGLAYVNRTHHFSDVSSKYPQATGLPFVKGKVEKHDCKTGVVIFVETLFNHRLFPSSEAIYKKDIVERIIAEYPQVGSKVSSGELELSVEFVKAGSLSGLQKKTELWSG